MALRRPLLLGTLWLTAAVAATSVGLLAVRLVGNEVGGQVAAPLSDEGVQQALGSVSPAPPVQGEPEAEQTTPARTQGAVRTVLTAGGVVSARCEAGRPRLLYATPSDGFRTERAAQVVTFVGEHRRVSLALTCAGEELRTTTRTTSTTTTAPTVATTPRSPAPVVQPSPTEAPEPSDRPEDSSRPEVQSGGSEGH